MTNRKCLLVLLRSTPALSIADSWPLRQFRVGDKTYLDVGLGDWTGFYDWLRRPDGELVGVRYWPSTPIELLLETARSLAYVSIETAGSIEILFASDNIEPERSADQEFQYDAVFRSHDGEWAIGFDMKALSQSDLDRLRQLNVAWHVNHTEN